MFKKSVLCKIILSVALGVIGGFCLTHPVQAAEQNQDADFEIQPILSDGQVNRSRNYFDLKFEPGSTHTISMRVQNFTTHKISVKTELQNAMTQEGGDMKYQAATAGLDESLKTPLTTLGSVNKKDRVINLGPEETTIVNATIKIPKDKFNGVIAGSWHFIENLKSGKGSGESISSDYAYDTGIIIRGSHYKVYPELKYSSATPIISGNRPAMGVKLRNSQPMLLNKVHFKAVVTKKGLFSEKRLYEKTQSSFAPNSSVMLPIAWNYDNMKPGKYEVAVKVTGENLWNKLPMSWTFKKSFKVTKKVADDINQQSVQRPKNRWFYVATASGVLLLISAVSLYKVIKIG